MSLSVSSLPPAFSFLRPAYRPSPQEVDAYAHIIANAEGYPPECAESRLHDEAELQLWIWRAEARKRSTDQHARRRRAQRFARTVRA
jgi:hypothetical protein